MVDTREILIPIKNIGPQIIYSDTLYRMGRSYPDHTTWPEICETNAAIADSYGYEQEAVSWRALAKFDELLVRTVAAKAFAYEIRQRSKELGLTDEEGTGEF